MEINSKKKKYVSFIFSDYFVCMQNLLVSFS